MEEHHDHDHDHDHSKHYLNGHTDNEDTPLLSRDASSISPPKCRNSRPSLTIETYETLDPALLAPPLPPSRRPSIQRVLTTKVVDFGNAIVSGAKHSCDEGGPCYGYSEPCGHECLKTATISSRRGSLASRFTRAPSLVRTNTNPFFQASPLPEVDEEASISPTATTSHPHSPPSRPSIRSRNTSRSFRSVRSRPSTARSTTSTTHISTHIPFPKHEHAAAGRPTSTSAPSSCAAECISFNRSSNRYRHCPPQNAGRFYNIRDQSRLPVPRPFRLHRAVHPQYF